MAQEHHPAEEIRAYQRTRRSRHGTTVMPYDALYRAIAQSMYENAHQLCHREGIQIDMLIRPYAPAGRPVLPSLVWRERVEVHGCELGQDSAP